MKVTFSRGRWFNVLGWALCIALSFGAQPLMAATPVFVGNVLGAIGDGGTVQSYAGSPAKVSYGTLGTTFGPVLAWGTAANASNPVYVGPTADNLNGVVGNVLTAKIAPSTDLLTLDGTGAFSIAGALKANGAATIQGVATLNGGVAVSGGSGVVVTGPVVASTTINAQSTAGYLLNAHPFATQDGLNTILVPYSAGNSIYFQNTTHTTSNEHFPDGGGIVMDRGGLTTLSTTTAIGTLAVGFNHDPAIPATENFIGDDGSGSHGININVPTGTTYGLRMLVNGLTNGFEVIPGGAILASPNSGTQPAYVPPAYAPGGGALGATSHTTSAAHIGGCNTGTAGTTCSIVVNFSGNAAWSSVSTYGCVATGDAPNQIYSSSNGSASSVTFVGFNTTTLAVSGTTFSYICQGT